MSRTEQPVKVTAVQPADPLAADLEELDELGKAGEKHGFKGIGAKGMAFLNGLPREDRIELAKWILRPENYETVTHALNGKTADKQEEMLRQLAGREDVKGSMRNPDVDTWLRTHSPAMARRQGRRR